MKQQLATDLKSRDGDTGQDARLVNAYVDVKRGIPFVVKRPSLEAALELPTGTGAFSTLGQALYVWQEVDVDSTTLTTSVVGIRGDRGKKTPETKPQLFFTTQPSNASRNTAISPSVVVTARDIFGNTKTDFTGNVTLSFATNRYGATLSGTLTVAAVAGVATFSNVQLNRSGSGFALRATATGAKPATSSTFDVPTALVFTTQPSSVPADQTFTVVVASRDTAGNTDTNYTGNVTISLNGSPGVLSGTLTQTASAGVATFTGISVNADGTYTLTASGTEVSLVYPPTPVTSNSFTIADGSTLIAVDIYGDGFTFGKNATLGSLLPQPFSGRTVRNMNSTRIEDDPNPGDIYYITTMDLTGSPAPTQSFFATVTINGQVFASADATFSSATWEWQTPTSNLTAAGTYTVTFT